MAKTTAGPPAKKIIAALETVCKKRKAKWPMEYPANHNIKPSAQDYGFLMEIRSVLSTVLGWEDLLVFIKEATGKTPKRVDWSETYNEAMGLVHIALNVSDTFDDEVEPKIPNREATLKLWGIGPEQLAGEKTMAKTATNGGKQKVEVATKVKSKAAASVDSKEILPERAIVAIELASTQFFSMAEYLREQPKSARLKSIIERIEAMATEVGGLIE